MRRALLLGALCLAAMGRAVPAQSWFEGADEWYLSTADGCRLYVLERGKGPDTVVVLNGGFGQDHTYMLPAFEGIEDRYRVIYYDPRGALRSPCPDSLVSLQKHVADLEALRVALRTPNIDIAGHSMGTILAMTYLQQHPGSVRALALLGALPARTFPEHEGTSRGSRMIVGRDTMRNRPAVLAELRKAGVDGDTALLSPKQRAHAAKIRLAGMAMYRVDRWPELRTFYSASAGAAAGRTVPQTYDFTPAIAAHRCRVWVLIGDHDYVDYGLPEHRRWTASVPNARLAVFPNAGHVLWLDDPERFRTTLLDALGEGAACRPA
ncbi:MAG TPA: alpha/beta hydrolase [Gemmatimonadaceae bacterium]|nr:alpha/beta hydrolase [Gemmatimonadaceae bacterium]